MLQLAENLAIARKIKNTAIYLLKKRKYPVYLDCAEERFRELNNI